jgi:lipoprotein signal peptidase
MRLAALLSIGVLIAIDQAIKHVLPSTTHAPHTPLVLSIPIILIACYILYKGNISKYTWAGITAIIAGGISNISDHILVGAMLDNLSIGTIEGNLADIYIVSGSALVVVTLLAEQRLTRSRV